MKWDHLMMQELANLRSAYIQEKDLEPCSPLPRTIEDMARLFAEPAFVTWLTCRASLTPYTNIDGYMERHWLFNPYFGDSYKEDQPSGRIHHILREDHDRDKHDHPWPARTIILLGWYKEERQQPDGSTQEFLRQPGDTATLDFGEYHRITEVSPGGVWTLFMTEEYQGTWGFLVDGVKVPYRRYLGLT